MTGGSRLTFCNELIALVKEIYGTESTPLHRPVFAGDEREYLVDSIDSNFVSSVGARVTEFEELVASFVGAKFGIATMNGTAALHASLVLAGVQPGDEVITQALTFVATANAISYVGAKPIFVDVDRHTLGMSPDALRAWLASNAESVNGVLINRSSGARIAACLPMHSFGIPLRIRELLEVCSEFGIPLIEDAAEALGSLAGGQHTGTFGLFGTFSFNGNKIITTGGGGVIVTDQEELAIRAKHIATTAKRAHPYEFFHDEIGYNYRLPNLNAALGVAQMEVLPKMLQIKAETAALYREFFLDRGIEFVDASSGDIANYWLNTIVLEDRDDRDALLKATNKAGIMTRPIWRLMTELPMYERCQHDGLSNSSWLADRVVNVPSSVPESQFERLST